MFKFYFSDIPVLRHLLAEKPLAVLVYDPRKSFISGGVENVYVLDDLEKTDALFNDLKLKNWVVVNLSGKKINVPFADFIVEFNRGSDYPGKKKTHWNYIHNPGQTIRWLYPKNITKPWFLEFYNAGSFKAKLYKAVVHLAFAYRFNALFRSGYMTIHSEERTYAEKLLTGNSRPNYAIFTGTTGPNRKLILANAAKGFVSDFIKIGLSQSSVENLHHENIGISMIRNLSVKNLVIPSVKPLGGNTFQMSNIKPPRKPALPVFGDIHLSMLEDLYWKTGKKTSLKSLFCLEEAGRNIRRAGQNPMLRSVDNAAALHLQLDALYQQVLQAEATVPVAFMHGDFTPWNMYTTTDKIHLYDWELSKPHMPLLFDAFHYILQQAILVERAGAKKIMQRIADLKRLPSAARIIREYDIDMTLHFRLYLIYTASYYVEMFLRQEHLHTQAHWLMATWTELLEKELELLQTMSHREDFLNSFFEACRHKEYAVLKTIGKNVRRLPDTSDIDLLTTKATATEIAGWCKSRKTVLKYTVRSKSFMQSIDLYFQDGGFLSIDMLYNFQRKKLQYLRPELLLNNRVLEYSYKKLPVEWDYLYTWLFYTINGSGVSDKYCNTVYQYDNAIKTKVLEVLQRYSGNVFPSVEASFAYSETKRRKTLDYLKKQPQNNIFYRAQRGLDYVKDNLRSVLFNRGKMIAFTGVDGAGKTTVLMAVKKVLEEKYRRQVVIIRHRPSVLPILSAYKYGKEEAEKRSVAALPRNGSNRNGLSSLLRFAYYFADFLFGQGWVYAKHILRGHIVLYDRYYYDFIIDGKRSNLYIPKGVAKVLYRFIQKPDLSIFLYAPPEVILNRKKELSASDISALTGQYLDLFKSFKNPRRYLTIENLQLGDTVDMIKHSYVQLV